MNLLVDIGNTRTKWRFVDSCKRVSEGVLLNGLLNHDAIKEFTKESAINSIMLSNVGKPELTSMFIDLAESEEIQCRIIEAAKEMAGLQFAYEQVNTLGVDRCLAMIGAFEGNGILVIDAGSAITADFLNAKGEHLGGYIFPGCNLLKLSLKAGTCNVSVDAELGSSEPGKSTVQCVNNGFTLMIQALVSGLIEKAKCLDITNVILTGGDVDLFVQACPDIIFDIESNLVLDGLEKLITEDYYRMEKP